MQWATHPNRVAVVVTNSGTRYQGHQSSDLAAEKVRSVILESVSTSIEFQPVLEVIKTRPIYCIDNYNPSDGQKDALEKLRQQELTVPADIEGRLKNLKNQIMALRELTSTTFTVPNSVDPDSIRKLATETTKSLWTAIPHRDQIGPQVWECYRVKNPTVPDLEGLFKDKKYGTIRKIIRDGELSDYLLSCYAQDSALFALPAPDELFPVESMLMPLITRMVLLCL